MNRFLEDGKWKCTKCGACCHFVRLVIPQFDRGDGACIYLTTENTCAIYETRPEICRVDTKNATDEELAKACKMVNDIIDQDEKA